MRKMPIGGSVLLPTSTGVYLFSDRRGTILYVGKAMELQRRAGSTYGGDFYG